MNANVPDKQAGDTFTADDCNSIVHAVNSKQDDLGLSDEQLATLVSLLNSAIGGKVLTDVNYSASDKALVDTITNLTFVVSTKADGSALIEVSTRVDTLEDQIGGLTGGFQGILTPTDPAPTILGVYYPTISGTYNNAGGQVVDLTLGSVQLILSSGTWYKVITPLDLTNYATKAQVDPIDFAVNGGQVFQGAIDALNTYTTVLGNGSTYFNATPLASGGSVVKIEGWGVVAGNVSIRVAHKGSGNVSVFTTFNLNVVLGDNTFLVNTHFPAFDMAAGDIGGQFFSGTAGQGKFGYKARTGGAVVYAGSANGSANPYTTTVSNIELGMKFTVTGEGLIDRVDILDEFMGDGTDFIKDEDLTLTIDPDNNIFSDGTITNNQLVKVDGTIAVLTGWAYWKTTFVAGDHDTVYVSGINARPTNPTALYWRFTNSGGTVLAFGAFTSGSTFSLPIPATAVEFDIDIMATGDNPNVYANAVISLVGLITAIKGNGIAGTGGGGDSFDQSLNTTNAVEFVAVTTEAIEITGPYPTNEADVPILGVWCDTSGGGTSGILKQRLS